MRIKRLLSILFLGISLSCISLTTTWARHIVGGELAIHPTATPGRHEVTLIIYWDENTLTNMNRDQTAQVLIYRKRDNQLMDRAIVNIQSFRTISYQNKACAASRSLKTLEGTYQGFVQMNPATYDDPEGYYLVWERCCRNDDINNILDPGSSGMTFYLEFSALTIKDSSPRFTTPNGTYICKDQPFSLNMSATDEDGDELKYSLVVPMRGNTSRNFPLGDDSPKQAYPSVVWSPGISLTNVIPGTPSLRINASTGELTVTANTLGLYVFAVQCEEYRNGKRIGLARRDFQLLVIECSQATPPEPTVTYNDVKTQLVEYCPERPFQLATSESPDWAYQWQLNGQNVQGATSARITVQDTGKYTVVKSFKTICSRDTTSEPVQVNPGSPPPAIIHYLNDTYCQGETMVLTANDGTVVPGLQYVWRNDKETTEQTAPQYKVTSPGIYFLNVTKEKNGCQAKDSIAIKEETVSVDLPGTMSMQLGRSVQLLPTVESNNEDLTYQWSPNVGLTLSTEKEPYASPAETTIYTLKVQTALGCLGEASIEIVVFDKLYIPDAFSPNGDGMNDLFEIRNAASQVKNIQIFNRWGETVFHATNYTSPWDGYYKGKAVLPGNYTYVVKTEHHTYQGQILVLY